MTNLINWLNANKIAHKEIDNEVVEIENFGLMYLADTSSLNSIIKDNEFNLPESQEVLIEEGIFYVAFSFGDSYYYYDLREPFTFNTLKYIGKREEPQSNIPFIHLGAHTPYELLNASGDIATLVRKAKCLGHTAIGICDFNTLAGTLTLQKECKTAEIKHIFGYSFIFEHLDVKVDAKVYAITQRGLQNLLRIQKAIMVDSDTHTISFDTLMEHSEGLALVLGKLCGEWLEQNKYIIPIMKTNFEKLYFQVDFSEYKAERIDVEVLNSQKKFFKNFRNTINLFFEIEPILICDSYYLDRDDARSKLVLNKIATGAAHRQSEEQYFKDITEHWAVLAPLFSDQHFALKLFERMCQNTVEIAEAATAKYETDRNFMPRYDMTENEKERYGDRHSMFLSLLEDGFERLVPKRKEQEYRERLNKEVYVLESTDNVDYLIIQWDTVNWARQNDILVGCGRGSAGSSLVLYLLGITLIDPIKYDLLFERFLLPERAGLYLTQTTKVVNGMESKNYIEIELENGKVIKLDRDARLLVKRNGSEITIYADELKDGDEIVFDHRDYLWNVNYTNDDKTL